MAKTKKRSTKRRGTKRRSKKRRGTKRRSTKKRSTKRRGTKRRSTKKRSTKRRGAKRRVTKKRSTKKKQSLSQAWVIANAKKSARARTPKKLQKTKEKNSNKLAKDEIDSLRAMLRSNPKLKSGNLDSWEKELADYDIQFGSQNYKIQRYRQYMFLKKILTKVNKDELPFLERRYSRMWK